MNTDTLKQIGGAILLMIGGALGGHVGSSSGVADSSAAFTARVTELENRVTAVEKSVSGISDEIKGVRTTETQILCKLDAAQCPVKP